MTRISSILPVSRKRFDVVQGELERMKKHLLTRRSFSAAQITRLTQDFATAHNDIQADIRNQGLLLIIRARDLAQNNAVAKRMLQLYITNVVGWKGHTFQPNVSETVIQREDGGTEKVVSRPDVLANTKILEGWEEWTKPENCSVDGRQSFAMLSKLIGLHKARDGEAFIRKVFRKGRHPLQLQIIPPEAIDFTYNTRLKNGNVVIMGVELDEWRKPVAYHMNVVKPESEVYGAAWQFSRKRERIPADEMIHWFDKEYFNQSRGITRFAQVMMLLHDLSRYEYAVLVNATVSASKMGFFGEGDEEAEELKGDNVNEEDGTVTIEAEAGTFSDIGTKKFFPWEPQFPQAQYEMYVRAIHRRMASGWGLAYSSLANDYGEANYSSLRAELLVERENWKSEQQSFIDGVLKPIYSSWLLLELMAGTIKLPVVKFEKFNNPVFVGPRWPWVDPQKDVEAKKAEVAAGWESPFGVIAEKGESDLEQIYRDNAEAAELAKKYNLQPDYGARNVLVPEQAPKTPKKVADNGDGSKAALLDSTNGNGHS